MKAARALLVAVSSLSLLVDARANTYGSVEPIANPAVIDTRPLRDQDLKVREAFAERLLQCGIVDDVIKALSSTRAITTVNDLNTHFEVGAGGFAGDTNPAYVYTIIDSGPNAASQDDVKVLTDSLGYVLSQGSAFLLDADDTASFDFPANYVVLNFVAAPVDQEVGGALRNRRPDRPRALRDRHERLHAVRPRLPLAPVRGARPAVHRRVRAGGGGVRRRVHPDRRRSPLAVRRAAPPSPATTGRRAPAARSTWPGSRRGRTRRSAASAPST